MIRICQGNDFAVKIEVERLVWQDGQKKVEDFLLDEVKELEVCFTWHYKRIEMDYYTDGNTLVVLDLITDSLDLSDCINLDRDSVRAVINAGKDQFSVRPENIWRFAPFASIKVAKSVFDKLTSEDISIATKKGWNVTI